MCEKFDLKWHTFQSHGQKLLKDLMETQDFSDVTLVSDNQHQYKVHRFILSACSSVFKNILASNPTNTTIYLRGIHHEELESILQFIYLGEATIKQERMNQFLNVAINMDVKELGSNILDKNSDLKEDNTFDPVKDEKQNYNSDINERLDESIVDQVNDNDEKSDGVIIPETKSKSIKDKYTEQTSSLTSLDKKEYLCHQCDYRYTKMGNLKKHLDRHEGIKYPCTQCDYQAPRSDNLRKHIRNKHEGIKYPCNHCEYKAAMPYNLKVHVKTQHEGIKYECQKCDCKFNHSNNLLQHIRYKHEEIKYSCLQCDFHAPRSKALERHMKLKHE